jgi:hypothetical protein
LVGVDDDADDDDDAGGGGAVPSSTKAKPKWYILDITQTRVFPITFAIRSVPSPHQ